MKPCILVVDDDPAVGPLLCEHLERLNYRVTYCNDAAQALIQAEAVRVGLIIMDIMLPIYGSGVDAYRSIRRNPHFPKSLPVIFLTALKPLQTQNLIPKDDPYIRLLHKPTTMARLVQTIQELTGDKLKDVPPPGEKKAA